MLIICDLPGVGCYKEFDGEVLTGIMIDDIERAYLQCPHCGAEYTLFYTNDWIKKLQEDVRLRLKEIDQPGSRPDHDCQKKWNKVNTLRKMISDEMHRLKEIHGEAE